LLAETLRTCALSALLAKDEKRLVGANRKNRIDEFPVPGKLVSYYRAFFLDSVRIHEV